MCGIAGFVDRTCDEPSALFSVTRMCDALRHRGPDDQGIWAGDGVALGMRRLAIIDVAGGQQPITNEDQSVLVVFNGEIYNHQELGEQLQKRGHTFRTLCDTEVIVHAYEEYGEECVRHLRGMFAFALWDRRRQRLLLARDRFGKKPLHYYWDGQRLVFGSEIKALLEAGVPRELNPQALDAYLLYRYVPTPDTLFQRIYKLPPAHLLVYEQGGIAVRRYWELDFTERCRDDRETARERTRALLLEAVRVRLMSEVPLGAFLSGGLDSSLIVGLMSQLQSQPVKTFSIGFADQRYNELPYARQVAQHFHTEHHEFIVSPDLVEVLPHLVWACDEPFADSSMVPTFFVSQLAREHVAVVLTGDGGDEIFGGYGRYAREQALERIPVPVRMLAGILSRSLPTGMRGKRSLQNASYDLATRYVRMMHGFPYYERSLLYTPEFLARIAAYDPQDWLLNAFAASSALIDPITRMQQVDVQTYLPDDILVKVDRMSMVNSLETRAPLLDHHLAEYVASLSPAVRLHGGILKALLREVAADIVPPEILTRPKRGFAMPVKQWFRGELRGYAWELLTASRAQRRGIFAPGVVAHLLTTHTRELNADFSTAIWALLCLELWFQTYMDQPSVLSTSSMPYRVQNSVAVAPQKDHM